MHLHVFPGEAPLLTVEIMPLYTSDPPVPGHAPLKRTNGAVSYDRAFTAYTLSTLFGTQET